MAPSTGQTTTQQPQYQHSPGYRTTGVFPFSALGMNRSTCHISTQLLQPVHLSASKTMGFEAAISGN